MSGGTAAGADIWDERAARPGLHAVLSGRWTPEECDRVDHEQKALIERLLPDLGRDRVIDLGCGVGRLTAWLSERTRSAVGVDRSAQMVRRAARAVEGKPARTVCSGIDELPFEDGSFDTVLAVFTLQHLTDDGVFRAALREMGRVVSPRGGRLLIVDGHNPAADSRDVSSATTSTVIRPLAAYEGLAAVAERTAVEHLTYVGDRYLAQLWHT
ncbi:class I SAM-dependent methyltransferase [Streptomyces spongiae]|uniref:Class I SAM-dependent methyltransferase n=1 Tax=Streptomyces spongiae TaxID=565072 RepID=A0A5N8XGQ5_9ACTN|nr:class I SAM-dependent methyltransferase [Streptomyces spongiae]MPY58642.1 class I SAM-dependent methyltransferase [Streptomyces spongiae]